MLVKYEETPSKMNKHRYFTQWNKNVYFHSANVITIENIVTERQQFICALMHIRELLSCLVTHGSYLEWKRSCDIII